jgi:glycosyltransferase involved in cell wall biosynthesis
MAGRRLSGEAHVPLVSINIPCYHQLALARRAVESVLAQSLTDIEIILHDDGASEEYCGYVESLRDPRVSYRRNPERLGAMRNMFAALGTGRGKYTMSFHEDDLLGSGYLAAAVGILESRPNCGFVACDLREFVQEPVADELRKPVPYPAFEVFADGADFVRGVVRGIEPMFGSVVYRRTAIEHVQPHHDTYATLVDRPYLLSIITRGWSAAVIREPLVWYRRHGHGDARHLAMTTDHVLELLGSYRRHLPERWNRQERAQFLAYTGYWLFELYRLTPPSGRIPVWLYLFKAWRLGIYDPRARGRFGLRQLQRAVLNQPS